LIPFLLQHWTLYNFIFESDDWCLKNQSRIFSSTILINSISCFDARIKSLITINNVHHYNLYSIWYKDFTIHIVWTNINKWFYMIYLFTQLENIFYQHLVIMLDVWSPIAFICCGKIGHNFTRFSNHSNAFHCSIHMSQPSYTTLHL